MRVYNRENALILNKDKVYDAIVYDLNAGNEIRAQKIYQRNSICKNSGLPYRESGGARRFFEREIQPRIEKAQASKNAATGYDRATLNEISAVTMVDVQRRLDERPDFTNALYNVTVDPNASKSVKIRDLLTGTVVPGRNLGTGAQFPLIEHKKAIVEELDLDIIGFADKSMLNEMLWSPNYDKLAETAANAIADMRNNDVFADMVDATYDANHSVTAAVQSGQSSDEANYDAINAAIDMAIGLKNPLNGRRWYNGSYETSLFVSKQDERKIGALVRGELSRAGGVRLVAGAIPIDNFVAYSGGIQNGEAYMGGTAAFPGVERGTAYLAIKGGDGAQLIKMIDWQAEHAPGQVRAEGDKSYWWTVYGKYNANVLPSTVGSDYFGAIVKITLV